jgi:hypothetical protein
MKVTVEQSMSFVIDVLVGDKNFKFMAHPDSSLENAKTAAIRFLEEIDRKILLAQEKAIKQEEKTEVKATKEEGND